MSSYINHKNGFAGAVTHDWADYTHKRLFWLYGPERAWAILKGNDRATNIDLGKWQALGRKDAA